MPREMTLSIEPKVGQIFDITVTVADRAVISADGSTKRSYAGPVPDGPTQVVIWVAGVPGSQYVVTVDAPGTANDFSAKYTLGASAQHMEFTV